MFKKAIQWVTGNKSGATSIKYAINWISSKVPIMGAVSSSVSVLKSMDSKSELYYNAGMGEAGANALAAADTIPEMFASTAYGGIKGPQNAIGKFTQWVTKSKINNAIYENSTNKTLNQFNSTRGSGLNSGTTTTNMKWKTSSGNTVEMVGTYQIDESGKITPKSNPAIEAYSSSDGTFKTGIEENVYLNDIGGVPTGQAVPVNNGLSNSSGVSDALIKIQQNIPSFNFEALASLGNLGAAAGGSVMGSILGMITGLGSIALGAALGGAFGGSGPSSNAFVSGYTLNYHNGGVVPGQGEVPALLKGGETVRTKAQEEELKQILYDKYVGNFIPTACGSATQPQRQQEQTAPQEQKSIHQQITRDDELYILNIIYDAIERNRSGLRNLIQAL